MIYHGSVSRQPKEYNRYSARARKPRRSLSRETFCSLQHIRIAALEVPVKRIAKWTGILLAVLILVVVSVPFLINVDQFRPTLQAELTRALGREVTLGNLRLKILRGQVTADDLSVAEDPTFGKPAFIKAQSLHVGVEIWPFIMSRKLIVTNLTIDQPDIELVQAPSGNWNFSSLGGKSATPSSGTPSSAQ